MPLPNHCSCAPPAPVACAAFWEARGSKRTLPTRLPISNCLRNLNKLGNLDRYKKYTHAKSTRLRGRSAKGNHPAGVRRQTVQVERSNLRNPNGFFTAPPNNRSI
jgi:hypothetical protein